MTSLSLQEEDERRVEAIRSYGLLNAPPRRDLVAVVDLAARICGVPMATINLITVSEQHQVAAVGFDASVCSREDSMCAAILGEDAPVVVPDARFDPRFKDNPFVTGSLGDVRFYAAHKLVTHEGDTIGTLCVFDTEVRHLDESQRAALATLADRIVDVLELSLVSRALTASLARVEAMRTELERSNERLASFAGQVSHDLKTPLTSVSLALSLIREQFEDTDDAPDLVMLLDRAINGSSRMAALIDDVLDYARLGGSLKAEDVDLGTVLADVVDDLDGALRGVAVDIGALPVVHGDEVQLRSVFQNLLTNAAKFRSTTAPPSVVVSAHRTAAAWRVQVSDNGPGVPAADRRRIFEPLTRLDHEVAGVGIGLATCRRIVAAHGGAIGVSEVEGGGATFWVELPFSP